MPGSLTPFVSREKNAVSGGGNQGQGGSRDEVSVHPASACGGVRGHDRSFGSSDRSLGSSATRPAAVRVVVHLRRGRTEVQLQRPDQRPCLASMQWRACSSVGRDGRLSACARLPQRGRLRAALEHRSRAKVGELHHQLPQGFVRAATAAASEAADGTASSPAAHVVRAVPHGKHGACRVAARE